ncbi:hypothetical protein H6P81_017674 [Aristolochia fimbriata]|uniref:Uncharacterized protein n=1 Tax=Aristolochia fimbriata TaxID=158543 RepID=A0AAV7E0T6_ARIFI|nr:hypothetical protein H6P81_017674 [Aristolochia fimbriata]
MALLSLLRLRLVLLTVALVVCVMKMADAREFPFLGFPISSSGRSQALVGESKRPVLRAPPAPKPNTHPQGRQPTPGRQPAPDLQPPPPPCPFPSQP